MTAEYVWRYADWQERAERHSMVRDHFRKREDRTLGLDCPNFSRLFQVLGGPFFLTPDGRYGPFPYADYTGLASIGCDEESWGNCSAVPFSRVEELDFGADLERDERRMLWPWIAKFACDYAKRTAGFDRTNDLTPSELDEVLGQVSSDAVRLITNLDVLQRAEYMPRSHNVDEHRKRIALAQISGHLRKAVGPEGGYFAVERLSERLRALSESAREAMGALASADIAVRKVSNAGVSALTIASAYIWADIAGRTPTAARRTSRNAGEESDFVLFVQSIARLLSNEVPSIAQIDGVLKGQWKMQDEDAFALPLRWRQQE